MADPAALRRGLVERLCEQVGAISEPVAAALRTVPRHVFVADVPIEQAYRDEAVVTKRDADGVPVSSSSQPAIMAIMLDQLDVRPGQRVLEIGAGTGYNAALLAHLVGTDGEVVTVDIDPDVAAMARAGLVEAGAANVTAVCADGADGYADRAPYDRMIATVGVWDLAPAWLDQLAANGRIVVPLDLRGAQLSIAFERAVDGGWASLSVEPCGFMRLRGAGAGPEQVRTLEPNGRLVLMAPEGGDSDTDAVHAAIAQPPHVRPTGVTVSAEALFGGFRLWLALTDPRVCFLTGEGSDAPVLGRALRHHGGFRATAGLLDAEGIAVLARGASGSGPPSETIELEVHGYGPDGPTLAADLVSVVRGWDAAGRPSTDGLRVTAYPRPFPADVDGLVIDKVHTRLVLTWDPAATLARRLGGGKLTMRPEPARWPIYVNFDLRLPG